MLLLPTPSLAGLSAHCARRQQAARFPMAGCEPPAVQRRAFPSNYGGGEHAYLESPKPFGKDSLDNKTWVVALFNENERSWHGHTVLAVSGPTDSGSWTQTYDFLPGQKHRWAEPEQVSYKPVGPSTAQHEKKVEGFGNGRGYPDILRSTREGVEWREIEPGEASLGRRKSVDLSTQVGLQVPGFVRFRADVNCPDGPALYGKAVLTQVWEVPADKGQELQDAVNNSAKEPPAYAAVVDWGWLKDPHPKVAENCHSWCKSMLTAAGLRLDWGTWGILPSATGNLVCFGCGAVLLGAVVALAKS